MESVLVREREKEINPFQDLKHSIDELQEMQSSNREKYRFVNTIRSEVKERLSPKKIRVAPYVQLAAEIRFLLNAHGTPEEFQTLVRYLGEEKAIELVSEKTFYEMEWDQRFERLKAISEKIGIVLKDTEDAMPQSQAA